MKRAIVYGMLVLSVLVGAAAAFTPVRLRIRSIGADFRLISADTGDVMSGAVYRRFAARRQAVVAMKAALKSVAAAESAFVADSGRPTALYLLHGRYSIVNDKSNFGPFIEIQRDRWMAKVGNNHTTMSCMLMAMLDTTTWRYHAGEPVCTEGTP